MKHVPDIGAVTPSAPRRVSEAFDAECAALLRILETLRLTDFELITNCPPWTLLELVVHIAESIRMPDQTIPVAPASLPRGTAADYYRRPERGTVQYRSGNVEHARRAASMVRPDTVTMQFADVWKQTSESFAAHDPEQRMAAGGRALTVDAYLLTRLMSVAAHGVDIALTLTRPVWTTPQASRALRQVLVDLLGQAPPTAWTDQHVLEIGTGRRPLTDADRDALGPLGTRFPLLS